LLVRNGKGGRRHEVGMDAWAWEELQPWLELRVAFRFGPLFCVINGPMRLGITVETVHGRGTPMIPVNASLPH
jgi:hypothetical protein